MNKITQFHLVLPNELNHVGTLFGGTAMAAADKAGFIRASLEYPNAAFVTRKFEAFDFHSPAQSGDILTLETTITSVGTTSLTVQIKAANAKSGTPIFTTSGVFVNVLNGKKHPLVPQNPQENPQGFSKRSACNV